MVDAIIELLPYLHDPKVEVRAIALRNIVGFSDKAPYYTLLVNQAQTLAPDLKALCKEDPLIAHDAICSLINLSSDQRIRKELDDENFLKYLALLITNSKSVLADLACMLLSNITKYELICTRVLDTTTTPIEELSSSSRLIDHLIDAFVKGIDKTYNPEAEFHFLASVFANLTLLQKGRTTFIDDASYDNLAPLSKLLYYTEHQSIIRRGGVISTIKNVSFDTRSHKILLDPQGINILPFILLPLCGPEEFDLDDMDDFPEEIQLLPDDKKRETDPLLRAMLCETLLLLTTTRDGRDYLRAKKVYAVIQRMHLVEEDEHVQELCERLVQMLQRDEGEEKIVEIDQKEDSDDDDLKMEEIL